MSDNWVKSEMTEVAISKKLGLKVSIAAVSRGMIGGAVKCSPPAVASSNLCRG